MYTAFEERSTSIGGCLTRAEAALTRTRFSSRPESPQGLAPLAGEVARTKMEERDLLCAENKPPAIAPSPSLAAK
jgi:hypothetical protein